MRGFVRALGATVALRSGGPDERVLAKGIAETFYGGVIGLLVAFVGGVWLAFWAWKSRKKAV